MDEKEAGRIILEIIFLIAFAIIISRQLFPIFFALSLVAFLALIVVVVIELFNNSFGEFSSYVAGAFVIFFLLTSVTWFIGYGIGGTSFGQASLEIYYGITGAEQQINQALQDSINQVVNESCKTLDEQRCNILRTTAKSAQTLQEVTDKANQLKALSNKVKRIG